jgi:putative glutamine amidotransferase
LKLVAVSQRVDAYPDLGEWRDALDQRLGDFLLKAGYLLVPVPNILSTVVPENEEVLTQWLACVMPSAIVLSGGNDVGSVKARDRTEVSLLRYAEVEQIPVLGICRGMQMMVVHAEGELHAVTGHVRTRHVLHGEIARDVNSYHDFALTACPSGYVVLARSGDDEIEAIRHRSLPWEGWMWHPEREIDFHPDDIARIRMLFGEL